jgi:hypothetical protein
MALPGTGKFRDDKGVTVSEMGRLWRKVNSKNFFVDESNSDC